MENGELKKENGELRIDNTEWRNLAVFLTGFYNGNQYFEYFFGVCV